MTTKSASKIALINELNLIIEQRKANEKREKMIKDELRQIMGDDLTLVCEQFVVIRSNRSRKDLDKAAIVQDYGLDFIEKYSKTSTYEIMEVKTTMAKAL